MSRAAGDRSTGQDTNTDAVIAAVQGELIAALKRADALRTEAEAARAMAEEAVQAREQFLSIASHELRNPLATLSLTVQRMERAHQRGTLDDQQLARSISGLSSSTSTLKRLIDDLLDVARLQHGMIQLRLERLDLGVFLRGVLDREPWPRHAITSNIASEIWTDIDGARIEQIVANLLDNAVKYSPAEPRIEVNLRREDGNARLEVRDVGIGLPPGFEERIFAPFGRATNATNIGAPGLGLGLYLSRGIARQHGGDLWAKSEGVGRGTAVHLRLPIAGVSSATRSGTAAAHSTLIVRADV